MFKTMKKLLSGHLSLGAVTLYGHNAMRLAVQVSTRWGYLCFHPGWGRRRWALYLSPNATPWAATFARGPGLEREDILLAPVRRALFGHGFDTSLLASYEPYLTIKNDAEGAARSRRSLWTGGLRRVAQPA